MRTIADDIPKFRTACNPEPSWTVGWLRSSKMTYTINGVATDTEMNGAVGWTKNTFADQRRADEACISVVKKCLIRRILCVIKTGSLRCRVYDNIRVPASHFHTF